MPTAADLPLVGGHLALDFINTSDDQDPAGEDVLQTADDLAVWGRRCGLLSRGVGPADAEHELGRALSTRGLLHELFIARIDGRAPALTRLHELANRVAEAYGAGVLVSGRDGRVRWEWPSDQLSSVRHAVVIAALELLEAEPSDRLKLCPGENCGWVFLDTSKRGNRRWCSMSECGQEAKDEQRRARRRALGNG